jgi:CHAT domain-containing protein
MALRDWLFGRTNDPDSQSTINAVQEFLTAPTWSDARAVWEEHRELFLSDESDGVLERLARAKKEPQARRFVEERHALLRRWREPGAVWALVEMARVARAWMPLEIAALVQKAQQAMPAYLQNNDLDALDIAAGAQQQILDRSEFEQLRADWRAVLLDQAGFIYLQRYLRAYQMGDLDRTIDCFERAVALTPPGSPGLPTMLTLLGDGLWNRYGRTGELSDLNRAIDSSERAVGLTRPGSPALPAILNVLCNGLHYRYQRTAESADLDRVIYLREQALSLTPSTSPDLGGYLNNLGNALYSRYLRKGELDDLHRAIDVSERAVSVTPPGAPNLPMYLNNLGNGLRDRYMRMGQLADLDRAIDLRERAIAATPQESPNLPMYLDNLSIAFCDRYKRTGELADLDRAVDLRERAVAATPQASPDLARYLTSMGSGLHDRYARTRALADLNRAIECAEGALSLTSPDSPIAAAILNNLGNALGDRYERVGEMADLHRGIRAYRVACELGGNRVLEATLAAARNWGAWALDRSAWQEGAEAYRFGIEAIDSLLRVQLGRASKESWLREAQGLFSRAAYCLARASDPTGAVVALEQGRANLLTDALERDRANLAALQQSNPTIYRQYREAAERAATLEAQEAHGPNQPRLETPPPGLDYAAEARVARAKLDSAVEAIRQVPGHASFLKPPTFLDIRTAAAPIADGGGLVYLATIEQGSVACIVYANGEQPVKAVWLNLTEAELDSLLVRRRGDKFGGLLPAQLGIGAIPAELIEILPKVRDGLIAPLAAQLRAIGLTEVVLIPSGRLNLLPLHAVSYHVDGATRYFGDEFTVSYAPNARALLAARRELSNRKGAASLVGVGNPLPHPKPLVAAEAELEEIAELFARRFGATNLTLLLREKATKAALLKDLPEAGYVHLACHGGFDANAPLESALQLANAEPLNLRQILYGAAKPLHARLVALSACQTGISDFSNLPDEYIGMPAGFLQAGVPGVVATLWPVNDISTALLMIKFYEFHLIGDERNVEGPMAPAKALSRAQQWLREATNDKLYRYSEGHHELNVASRLPDVAAGKGLLHFQSGDTSRPFASPYYWAAFVFVGV